MKYFRIAIIAVTALAAASCSTAQTDKFIAGIDNFNRGVAAVDDAVARINASLYAKCKSIQTVGNAAVKVAPTCNTAGKVIGSVNAAINSLCQAGPATGLASTADVAADAYLDVKAQLDAAKTQCARGG